MPQYTTTEQLGRALKSLFARVQDQGPQALESLTQSKMIIRLNLKEPAAKNQPEAVVVINGRTRIPQVFFEKTMLRPDLEVDLSAETLHLILTRELRLGKALSQGAMKVRGNVLKGKVLEDILHQCQAVYPQVLAELKQDE